VHWLVVTQADAARTLVGCAFRRSAPLFVAHDLVRKPDTTFRDHAMRGAKIRFVVQQTSGAHRAARTEFYFVIASEAKQSSSRCVLWIASSLRSSQ